jgi:hypothetical protein
MIDQSIHSLASKLDRELQGGRSLDPSDRELLEQLRRDIQSILDGPDSSVALKRLDEGFLDRLREATNRFETSHPALTATMAQVTSTLSNMGI